MLHASPGSSYALEPLIERLASTRTVIAIDTPGFGESEALTMAEPLCADYAMALEETLDAMDLASLDLYGTHTGSKIATEFATQRPERVRRLVLDGIGAYSEEERADLLANYTPDLSPVWDGSHLIRAWTMRRDMHLFWPWFRRDAEHRIALDMPSVDELHDHFVDFLRAVPGYGKGYRAAFRYEVGPALEKLQIPTLLVALPSDPLFGYLEQTGQMSASISVDAGANDVDGMAARIVAFLDEGPAQPDAPPAPEQVAVEGEIRRRFVDVPGGVLHTRWSGGAGRPLVMLHSSPTSSLILQSLYDRFAAIRPVITFDNPGNGDSTALEGEPEISDLAEVMVHGLDALGVGEFDLYGSHTGAHMAIEVAIQQPERVKGVILDGIIPYEEEKSAEWVANYPPPLAPDQFGSHLIWTWHFIREMVVFWPWFKQRAANVRHDGSIPDPEVLHWKVVELLKNGRSYHLQYKAAFRYRTQDRLPLITMKTMVCASEADPLHENLADVPAMYPAARVETTPGTGTADDADATVDLMGQFFADG